MPRIAHLTDVHVSDPSRRICGLHTPSLLRQALAEVNRMPADFYDAVVISGDLTHKGEPEAYAELARCIAESSVPVHLMIGNHDDRAAFRTAFADEARYTTGDFVQYAVEFADYRMVMLDSNLPGEASGLLCAARLTWLDATLAERPATPTLVFVHHPPFKTHVVVLDAIGLDGIAGLAAVIDRHPQVLSIHAGHVHRTMMSRLGNVPAMTATSTCHQVALELEAPGLVLCYEPPSFQMILVEDGAVVSHTVFFTLAQAVKVPYMALRDIHQPV